MHSPFETFWLFCLLFFNTEVLKIQLNFVLLWAGVVVSVLPISSSWFCLLFLLDTQKWVLDWKAALGIMPNEPLRSLTIVVILPILCAGQHQPFSLAPSSLPPRCSAFCHVPPRQGRCDVSHGSSWLLPGVSSWPELLHVAVTPRYRSRVRGQAPSWSQSCLGPAPGTPRKGDFLHLSQPQQT